MPQEIALRESSLYQNSEDNDASKSSATDFGGGRTLIPAPRRRPHVTTACNQCRKAKARCEGKEPCSRCIEKLYTCAFAPEEDNRNRVGMKRKIESLESDVSILNALLSFIRDSEDAFVAHMIAIIRRGATIEELREFLHSTQSGASQASEDTLPDAQETPPAYLTGGQLGEGLLRSSSSVTSPLSRTSNIMLPRRVFGVNRLTDIPLFSVPAAPWTNVTDDNDLVSHLISLYATWEHVFFDGIIFEYFIRDMRTQDLGSRFCSPFLVNCILASACTYSDFDEARTSGCQTSTLMGMFIRQAESLRNGSPVASLITTAQGLSILSTATKKQNDESTSRYYAQQALSACSLLLSASKDILNASQNPQIGEELTCSLQNTLWGVLNVCGANLDGWLQPGDVRVLFDTIGDPPTTWQPVMEVWKPYPVSSEAEDSLYQQSRRYYASLAHLSYLISQQLSPGLVNFRSQVSDSNVSEHLADLSAWLLSLTNEVCTRLRSAESALPISAILLRWWAAYITMTISKAQAELEHRRSKYQMGPTTTTAGNESEPLQLDPKSNSISSALDVVELCRVFKDVASDYSRINPTISAVFGDALIVLASASTNLRDSTGVYYHEEYDSEVMELCDVLTDMARRNPYTAALAHRTLIEIRDRNFRLPVAAARKLDQIERPMYPRGSTSNFVERDLS